ncbi:unnamed protein product [Rhizophagus irregularis]|nr:unnamed protein product [Rhizophagus irregularis]
MDSYSNQSKGTNFSHIVAASTLAGGMNHYAMQTALAVPKEDPSLCHEKKQLLWNLFPKPVQSLLSKL